MSIDKSLFDLPLFDKVLFDDSSAAPVPAPITDQVIFNGFGLQNANITVNEISYSAPERALTETAYPRAHGEFIQTDYWRKTIITIKGDITAASMSALETLMDQMRQNLAVGNGLLQITSFAGVPRIWNAYAKIDNIFYMRKHYNIMWCGYQVSFTCVQPFGRNAVRDVLVIPFACTAAPTTYQPTNSGTVVTDSIWTFSMVAAGSCNQITLTNVTTSESIILAGAFQTGDLIIINGETHVVTWNGGQIDFTGVFPTVVPGVNTFTLSPNGAGFSIGVQEQHYARFL